MFYEAGKRSGEWVKFKINQGRELVLGGFTPGTPFHAVIVGSYHDDKLLYAGKVRAGFVSYVRRELMARMKLLETEVCPFANLPEKRDALSGAAEELKNCVWLKPELVVQIELPNRHRTITCSFVGLSKDKKARDLLRESGQAFLSAAIRARRGAAHQWA